MNGTELTLADLLGREVSSAPPLLAEMVRPLEAEDLLSLAEPRGVKPSALKRLRTIHHQIARMLAVGDRPVEVAAATGYSLSRISILQADQLFQELMSFYSEQEANRFATMQDQVESLGRAASEELLERVTSEEVELMSSRDLRQIMESALDRSGHSPIQRRQSMNVVLDAQELKALKEGIDANRTDRVVETAVEGDSEPGVGDAGDRPAAGNSPTAPAGVEG